MDLIKAVDICQAIGNIFHYFPDLVAAIYWRQAIDGFRGLMPVLLNIQFQIHLTKLHIEVVPRSIGKLTRPQYPHNVLVRPRLAQFHNGSGFILNVFLRDARKRW